MTSEEWTDYWINRLTETAKSRNLSANRSYPSILRLSIDWH
jgi:hypothetical protein